MSRSQIPLFNIVNYKVSSIDAVALLGFMDDHALPRLRRICFDYIQSEAKEFILDFSGVLKISDKVADFFSDMARALSIVKGNLFIMNISDRLRDKFTGEGRDSANIHFFSNETEAYRFAAGRAPLYCF